MRTTFNSSFLQSASDLSRTSAELARRQREVSSGRRLNTASDDPSAASGIVRERSEMAALDRYAQTADTANARLSIADSVLSDMIEQLTSARTTLQAARGSVVVDSQRTALASALAGVRDSLFSDYTTTFNGTYLVSGYAGTASAMAVDLDRNTSVEVSFNADEIARGSDTADIFTALTQAIADVQAGDQAGMAAAVDAVDRAFARATGAQSQIGTGLRAIETQQGRVADQHRASEGRAVGLEQVNMADSITKMTQADTAYRAALGAIGTTGRATLMDYLR